jgi:CheY-like chemotaxis protein
MKEVSHLNILIAEDDDAAAHLIKTNLRRAGMDSFVRAKNGEEVVRFLEEGNTTLDAGDKLVVLLDIRMPKMDGIQVLKYMKASSSFRKIPVIMLTTSDRPQEVEMCYKLGCNSYLKKQVDYSKFVETINKLAAFINTCEIPLFGECIDD